MYTVFWVWVFLFCFVFNFALSDEFPGRLCLVKGINEMWPGLHVAKLLSQRDQLIVVSIFLILKTSVRSLTQYMLTMLCLALAMLQTY